MSKKILIVFGSLLLLHFSAKAQTSRILYEEEDLKGRVTQILSVFYTTKVSKNGYAQIDTTQKKVTIFDDSGNIISIKTYLPFSNGPGGKTMQQVYIYKYNRRQDVNGNTVVDAYKNNLPISTATLDAQGHITLVKYFDKKGRVTQHANYRQNTHGHLATYLLFDEPQKPVKTETLFYTTDGNLQNVLLVNPKGKKLSDKHFQYSELDAIGNWTKRTWINTLDTENKQFTEERRYTYQQ